MKRKYWPVLSCGGVWEGSSRNPLQKGSSTLAKISITARPVNQGIAVELWKVWKAKNKHTFTTSWCLIWACIWTSHGITELWFHCPIFYWSPLPMAEKPLSQVWSGREPTSGVQRSGFHSSLQSPCLAQWQAGKSIHDNIISKKKPKWAFIVVVVVVAITINEWEIVFLSPKCDITGKPHLDWCMHDLSKVSEHPQNEWHTWHCETLTHISHVPDRKSVV